ncbi:MAG: transporter ATP-binding protein [Herbinix sp.]|jgi:peptide/nickel transport system ATP-binding protein|nr:transporter ATP-binding protein [Herbinix sp.]
MKDNPVLQVEDLTIGFPGKKGMNTVLDHVTFSLGEGEILGIVGESGSGKTMTALTVMGLLPASAQKLGGSVIFLGKELLTMSKDQLRELKGTQVAMIFQEPMTSFNPLLTIGVQVEEMLKLHTKLDKEEYKKRTLDAFTEAGLPDAEEIYHKYPHQLSGGMRQRAMIAMAMIAGPKLLIADEPTTALDVTIQDKILKLLKNINQTHGTTIILISHDLGVIKSICQRALVMKDGQLMEEGPAKELLLHPKTDYTKELVAAVPAAWLKSVGEKEDLVQQKSSDGKNKSIRQNNLMQQDIDQQLIKTEDEIETEAALLTVEALQVYYPEKSKGIFSKKGKKHVVKNACLSLKKGEALGIVGESGCGKSTLAKAIAGLIKDTEGNIRFIAEGSSKKALGRPQMVFQDPYGSLNPVKKVGWILEEPLKVHGGLTAQERKDRVVEVMNQVGLKEKHLDRYVAQLSGGQRQRVAIAAAFILHPDIIILDEPVSSLDVTVQAQILKLLKQLQKEYQLSYLFISHDLNVIYQMCDRVCVMYQGEIVETRTTRELFHHPNHAYTKVLLDAALPE